MIPARPLPIDARLGTTTNDDGDGERWTEDKDGEDTDEKLPLGDDLKDRASVVGSLLTIASFNKREEKRRIERKRERKGKEKFVSQEVVVKGRELLLVVVWMVVNEYAE